MGRKRIYVVVIACIGLIALSTANYSTIKRFIYNRSRPHHLQKLCPQTFSSLLKKPSKPWMINRIHKDLERYAHNPITRKRLDSLYKELQNHKIVRFQIRGPLLNYQTTCPNDIRFISMRDGLQELTILYPHLDVDFIVSLENDLPKEKSPIFVFAKNKYDKHQILVPDFTCFAKSTTTDSWLYHLQGKIKKASKESNWNKKVAKGIWRGGTSGVDPEKQNFISTIRCKLCMLSKYYPEFLDANFTDNSNLNNHLKKQFSRRFSLRPFTTPEQHLNYKYLICVDGNTCSFPGLQWRLLSNSLVIKAKSKNIQWFYDGLIPDHHYLSVDRDLANLIPKIAWAKDHDDIAFQIAQNASKFAVENLSQEAIFQYLCLLLIEYQKVYQSHAMAFDSRMNESCPFFTH